MSCRILPVLHYTLWGDKPVLPCTGAVTAAAQLTLVPVLGDCTCLSVSHFTSLQNDKPERQNKADMHFRKTNAQAAFVFPSVLAICLVL